MSEEAVIGSVAVSVTPDARDFWRRFEEQTSGGATRVGEHAGKDIRRAAQAELDRGVTVRADADTARAQAKLAALQKSGQQSSGGLLKALLPLAPALVPLGAAAGVAGAEFVALGAAGVLAIRGIKTEMATGTTTGVAYRQVVGSLKADVSKLQVTAAKGLLPGAEQAAKTLRASLPQLNALIGEQSRLLGSAGSHVVSGLVGGFETFAPVLHDVEVSVANVAAKFDQWANGPGGAKFAATLHSDYLKVAPVVDEIASAIVHLLSASNGVGVGIVSDVGLLARVVSEFPTPALEAIIGGLVLFKTASGVNSVVASITASIVGLQATRTASAAATVAASATEAAATTAAAAQIAQANLAEAESAQASLVQIVAAREGSSAAASAAAAAALAGAEEEVAAYRAAAVAATLAAEQKAAAAEATAIASATAARAAGVGMSAALGPVGLLVGGLLLLATQFSSSSGQTDKATEAIHSYTDALVQSKGAVDAQVSSQVAQNVQSARVLSTLKSLGITTDQVTAATLGNKQAQAEIATAMDAAYRSGKLSVPVYGALKAAVTELASGYQKATVSAAQQVATQKLVQQQAIAAAFGLDAANASLVSGVQAGTVSVRAYVDAVDAFNKSADTAADRAKLIGAALVAANGDTLGYAHTMVQAAVANQQLATDFHNLKAGVLDLKTGTLDYHNAAAGPLINDLQALQTAAMNAASATYQHELATKGAKAAAADAFTVYKNDTRGALIDEATQLGLTGTQAGKLADTYFGLKNSSDIKKKIELIGEDKVTAALQGILNDLDILVGKTTVLDQSILNANSDASHLPGVTGGGSPQGKGGPGYAVASGGFIAGPGTSTSDSIPAYLSNGEYVINAAATAKHRPLLDAINYGAKGYEAGGFAGVDTSGNADKYGHVKTKKPTTIYTVQGVQYTSLHAAENAAVHDFKVQVALGLKIDTKDLAAFKASLKGTADQAHAAFVKIYDDAKKLGISNGLAATLRTENAALDKEISARNKAADLYRAALAKFNEIRNSIQSATTGSFDVTSAGAGFDGQQPITGANILAQQTQDANRVKLWVKDIKGLEGKVNGAYLEQLAQAGPSSLPEVEALKGLSVAQLAQLNAERDVIADAGKDLGASIGRRFEGADMSKYRAEEIKDQKQIIAEYREIARQIKDFVHAAEYRPIEIKVDGRVIARATATGAKKNARRG